MEIRWLSVARQVGQTKIPKQDSRMTKFLYQIQLPNGLSKEFRKSVYQVHAEKDLVVVQYMGNADAAVGFPHANAKRPVNFLRTAKSVTSQLPDKNSKLSDIRIETANEAEQLHIRDSQRLALPDQPSGFSDQPNPDQLSSAQRIVRLTDQPFLDQQFTNNIRSAQLSRFN